MKKQFFTLSIFLLFISLTVNAQKTAWGLTASVIYASNGELIEDATNVIDNKGDGGVGFNAGIYGNLNLGLVYIRPKLVYSQTSSSYNLNSGSSENFKLSSLDLPVLVGIKIIKPLSFVVGPAFQYIINSKMESVSFENIQNNITVGLNIGVSIIVSRITIDLLYDRSFTENEANFIDNNTNTEYTLDTRPQQFVVGLSYRFGKK